MGFALPADLPSLTPPVLAGLAALALVCFGGPLARVRYRRWKSQRVPTRRGHQLVPSSEMSSL